MLAKCRVSLPRKGANVKSKAICYQITSTIAQMKRLGVLDQILFGNRLVLFLVGRYFEKTSQELSKLYIFLASSCQV